MTAVRVLTQFLHCKKRRRRPGRPASHFDYYSELSESYSFGTQDSIDAGVACEAGELELVHQGTDLLQV
jgi:hypothetical protein